MEKDDNSYTARLGKLTKRREWNYILLGCALLGSASTFIINIVIQVVGIRFSFSYFLITSALGALFGIIVAFIVHKHDGSRLASLAFTLIVGLLLPICLLQILFLIFPIDP